MKQNHTAPLRWLCHYLHESRPLAERVKRLRARRRKLSPPEKHDHDHDEPNPNP